MLSLLYLPQPYLDNKKENEFVLSKIYLYFNHCILQ